MEEYSPTQRLAIHALCANHPTPLNYLQLSTATGSTPATMEVVMRQLRLAGVVTVIKASRNRIAFALVGSPDAYNLKIASTTEEL
jgi:hypothetical protein